MMCYQNRTTSFAIDRYCRPQELPSHIAGSYIAGSYSVSVWMGLGFCFSVMAVPGLDPGIDPAIHENTAVSS
jgi:hypothetical protein